MQNALFGRILHNYLNTVRKGLIHTAQYSYSVGIFSSLIPEAVPYNAQIIMQNASQRGILHKYFWKNISCSLLFANYFYELPIFSS